MTFGLIHTMVSDKSAGGIDQVRLQDTCAKLEASMASAKLSAGQKKPFEVCIAVVQAWSKLRIATAMSTAASKLFKGDHLQHVDTIQERVKEARVILEEKPDEFYLSGHGVCTAVVDKILNLVEKEATEIAKDTLMAEFDNLEKKMINFARLMSLLPSPEERKKYLLFFKQKDQSVKDITSMIDRLDKERSVLHERVTKFNIKIAGYGEKMEDMKSRLHDGDSAVSCQALVMLLSNQKLREPGSGKQLRNLLDQVLPNFQDTEDHKAHKCPAALIQEARGVADAFHNKDENGNDGAEDDKDGCAATSKDSKDGSAATCTCRKKGKASEPSNEEAASPSKGKSKTGAKGEKPAAEDGKGGRDGKGIKRQRQTL